MKRFGIVALLMLLLLAGCYPAPTPPASVPAVDTGVDPEAWALIPAGPFLMGPHKEEAVIDYDYEMMVTDVTNAQFARYLNEALASGAVKLTDEGIVAYYPGDPFDGYDHEREIKAGDWLQYPVNHPDAKIVYENGTFTVKPGFENHPVTMVTWFGAKGYCEYYGWRLPTEKEWEKAARGTDGRAYPWGNEITEANANYYKSRDPFEKYLGGLGETTPVGFYNGGTYLGFQTEDSPSPYGLYDMAGNVWQWTADDYEKTHLRYLRGGSRSDYAYDLRVWTRNSAGPDYYSPSIGFRCARDR